MKAQLPEHRQRFQYVISIPLMVSCTPKSSVKRYELREHFNRFLGHSVGTHSMPAGTASHKPAEWSFRIRSQHLLHGLSYQLQSIHSSEPFNSSNNFHVRPTLGIQQGITLGRTEIIDQQKQIFNHCRREFHI